MCMVARPRIKPQTSLTQSKNANHLFANGHRQRCEWTCVVAYVCDWSMWVVLLRNTGNTHLLVYLESCGPTWDIGGWSCTTFVTHSLMPCTLSIPKSNIEEALHIWNIGLVMRQLTNDTVLYSRSYIKKSVIKMTSWLPSLQCPLFWRVGYQLLVKSLRKCVLGRRWDSDQCWKVTNSLKNKKWIHENLW